MRHSFTSLLLHEGRSVIYVARQLGHSAQLTMRTYGHVIEELEDAPLISAEDAITLARESVSGKCPAARDSREASSGHKPCPSRDFASGRYWARTSDLLLVRQALYQLS